MRKLWSDGIPEILKQYGMFCLNKNKVPYKINGELARPDVIGDFTSYKTAKQFVSKGYDGISLGLFTAKSGLNLCAIDIDHCIDSNEKINPNAMEMVNKIASYAEYSPSRTGIHIVFYSKTTWDKDSYYTNKRQIVDSDGVVIECGNTPVGLEIYNSGMTHKVIRMSESPLPDTSYLNTDIKEVDIQWLLDEYMKKQASTPVYTDERIPQFKGGIDEFIRRDKRLAELYNNTEHDETIGDSQYDMSLCCKLAFWTGKNESEIDRLFRLSPWFESKNDRHVRKWIDRKDYRITTIRKACSLVHYNSKNTDEIQDDFSAYYTYDDVGNAHRFIDSFGCDLRWNVENKAWMIWNGDFWQTDMVGRIRTLVDKMVAKMQIEADDFADKEINGRTKENPPSESAVQKYKSMMKNISYLRSKKGKDNCLSEAQTVGETPVVNSMFDQNPDLLCTKKGTYDLKTGEVKENDRLDYFTKCVSYAPDFENKPTQFIKFLKNVLKNHPETYDYVHRMLGYSITDETREQKIFFLYGDGNDGKSVLLDTVSKVLGDYAASAKKDLVMDGYSSNNNDNSLARIKAKRLVWIDEVGARDKLNEGLVKNITSGTGEITARYLYANEFSYKFTSKVIITTNYEPRITGVDKGIWRRIIVLPFDLGLKESEVDRHLGEKLADEYPQILAWLIDGAKLYFKKGLADIPQCSLDLTSEYKEESDEIQIWLDECTDTAPEDFPNTASELYNSFITWALKENQPKLSQTIWGKSMRKKFKKARINHMTVYFGLRLANKSIDRNKAQMARSMAENISNEKEI